jgi:hypothetical protein
VDALAPKRDDVSQLDYVLLSPALDGATAGVVPRIERREISFSRILTDVGTGPKRLTPPDRRRPQPHPYRLPIPSLPKAGFAAAC